MLKAAAEWIGEEGQSMVPEFLQVWIQLMKAPARSFEQNRRDGLVRVEWFSARLQRILVEIYWFRMHEMVDGARAELVALTALLDAKPVMGSGMRIDLLGLVDSGAPYGLPSPHQMG